MLNIFTFPLFYFYKIIDINFYFWYYAFNLKTTNI
nr:MAG TPA: hypothetical protein [Ackermannviridae sp.]